MKVALVCEWEGTGGIQTVIRDFINTLIKMKYSIDIHIVSFGDNNEIIYENGYVIHFIKRLNSPISRYWQLPELLKNKVLEIDPDLIHLHLQYPPYSSLTQLPIPVITTIHGLSNVFNKSVSPLIIYLNFSFILTPYFEKKLLHSATKIIAVSSFMKNNVDSIIGKNSKTIFIPNGIDPQKYVNRKVSKQKGNPSLFCAGRLIKIKGIDILLKSLPAVKIHYPDVRLYIAGDGPQYNKLKILSAKLGLDENIAFLGFLNNKEMIQFFASTDIFVMPSRFENAPITLIEALASGIPIVASDVGGIPEILCDGKYGILVEPENPIELARNILELTDNLELRTKMSEIGKERAQEYTWDLIVKKTIELYQSVI